MRLLIALIILFLLIPSPAQAEWPYDQFNCRAYRADLIWRDWARRHCPGYRWRYHRRYRHVHRAPQPDADVMRYQLLLRERGFDIEADGLMGPDTREALRRFQRRHELDPTGDLGRATKRALRRAEDDTDGDEEEWRDCKPQMRGIGTEDYSIDDAKQKARANWLERVRFRYGVMYMDPRHARNVEYLCGQSGTGGRKGEKFTASVPFGIAKGFAGGDVLLQCEVVAQPCATPAMEESETVERRSSSSDFEPERHSGGHQ